MKTMSKVISVFAILSIVFNVLLINQLVGASQNNKELNKMYIEETTKNLTLEKEQKNVAKYQYYKCVVLDNDPDNDGYVIAQSVDDETIKYAIEKENFKLGDIVTVKDIDDYTIEVTKGDEQNSL